MVPVRDSSTESLITLANIYNVERKLIEIVINHLKKE